ncbi:glycosyltransferase family 4 protein [Actinopolymorpha alba]|uniref:glycosyltransferase family 4 protein n=1 Tax=Actinopolymorpha alba TaxID=533267 RepID=UPI00039DA379|nr:glycosyltransferase family 4 protein [Actinopolymorpha alba]
MTEVLLICADRSSWSELVILSNQLYGAGAVVRVACGFDRRGLEGLQATEVHELRMSLTGRSAGVRDDIKPVATWLKASARSGIVRSAARLSGAARRTWILAKYDPWLRACVRRADAVVAADPCAVLAVRHAARVNAKAMIFEVGASAMPGLVDRVGSTDALAKLLGAGMSTTSPESVLAAWRAVVGAAESELNSLAAEAPRIVQLLRLNQSFDAAEQVCRSALTLDLDQKVLDVLQLEIVTVQISAGRPGAEDLGDRVQVVLRHAEEALRDGRAEYASRLVVHVIDVMFHYELHADVLSSPLVADPDRFLRPLLSSQVVRALGADRASVVDERGDDATAAVHPGPRPESTDIKATRRPKRRHRLLVIPGKYPQHTKGIIAEFQGQPDVDLHILTASKRDARPGRQQTESLITDRLMQVVGERPGMISEENRRLLAWADTIFVDWCDNAAIWATIHAPRESRLIIRIHSIDALSHHPHMIDWTRVSDVIFVADHIRELVQRAIPAISEGPRIHVLPNVMALEWFGLSKRPGADRTIAMIGWAQRVKDPVWALDVLAQLRSHDPTWRLLLLGNDFQRRAHTSAMRYRDRFRERAQCDDVRDGIIAAGFCDNLPEALRDAGFILGASRREAFPVGSTEGAASGAVPVIRDWPMVASYGAARQIYPEAWIVENPHDAANRILAHSDSRLRAEAGDAARQFVVERFDAPVIIPRYRQVLIGSW